VSLLASASTGNQFRKCHKKHFGVGGGQRNRGGNHFQDRSGAITSPSYMNPRLSPLFLVSFPNAWTDTAALKGDIKFIILFDEQQRSQERTPAKQVTRATHGKNSPFTFTHPLFVRSFSQEHH
jgi:hypothetical protein